MLKISCEDGRLILTGSAGDEEVDLGAADKQDLAMLVCANYECEEKDVLASFPIIKDGESKPAPDLTELISASLVADKLTGDHIPAWARGMRKPTTTVGWENVEAMEDDDQN